MVADAAHHDLAGVHADAEAEVEAVSHTQLITVAAQRIPQAQRRVTRPLGVILVSDRRPEQRHDVVATSLGAEPRTGEPYRAARRTVSGDTLSAGWTELSSSRQRRVTTRAVHASIDLA